MVSAVISKHDYPCLLTALALASGIWYIFIIVVQSIGFFQLFRYYSTRPKKASSPNLKPDEVPLLTVLRPVQGLDPYLYDCLLASFQQDYPLDKFDIHLCIASKSDPAMPVLQRLVNEFPSVNAKIFIEEEDGYLFDQKDGIANTRLGPNPKIRNLSRGYREARGDIVWILDCNVWIGRDVAGRMVDKLCGYRAKGGKATPYKFVHQLPLVINVDSTGADQRNPRSSLMEACSNILRRPCESLQQQFSLNQFGGKLEEMFMSSSHAKFYTAINTVSVAPCIVGKSNMFRKSHLDYLTAGDSQGLDYFSKSICEDHLIGDLIWRGKVLEEERGQKYHRHGLLFGDLAIQPMAKMSLMKYIGRRVRWLRVRKWTVPLATMIEPGVEPFFCSLHGAFAITHLPWVSRNLGITQSWYTFVIVWLISISTWMLVDTLLYARLHSAASTKITSETPVFARPASGLSLKKIKSWIVAWLGREILALPIWIWACLCGTTVNWRGRLFRVRIDMTVVEVFPQNQEASRNPSYRKIT
ncbi:ceramide glucosyltransferase [Blumeria hordei DH14]|uniref:Ceramide glucosyltransferase n=1 Tax=Blumeria graminis f. sp. hordei (strain DH14) TaxID=546991 RepID=N1JJK4_BLUG1|nr:ceramide glucosyltransferase [Blumeria hordei DH14]